MPKKFAIFIRNFIPTKSLYGFKGDDRRPSTSTTGRSSSHRTGLILYVDLDKNIVYDYDLTTSGTTPLNWFTKLVRGVSTPIRYIQGKSTTRSDVRMISFNQKKISDRLYIKCHFAGNDPAVVGAPDIDTHLEIYLYCSKNGNLSIWGNVKGDKYPSNELFISDSASKKKMLSTFNAKDGWVSPTWELMGDNRKLLGRFRWAFILDKMGNFA